MPALDILFKHHRDHYVDGTLEYFLGWFEHTGCGDLIRNPYLNIKGGERVKITRDRFDLSNLSGLSFENASQVPWEIEFHPLLDRDAASVKDLFRNFVRSTAHTHPLGDFRSNLDYYTDVLAGPRNIVFHGPGSCLLLGTSFQSLVSRLTGEKIDLYYSHTASRDFTHFFGKWRNTYFVDPDQKTWSLIDEIDRWPSLGYIFQQIGVAGHLIYKGLTDKERATLFPAMTRDYFRSYEGSTRQYMYRRAHKLDELASRFYEARTKHCFDFSIDADDFSWKSELRRRALEGGIARPYFMSRVEQKIVVSIPSKSAFRLGFREEDLPEEIDFLAAIFFGRMPGILSVPLEANVQTICRLPEFPWMVFFDNSAQFQSIIVNDHPHALTKSRCGKFKYLGMDPLERAIGLTGACDGYILELKVPQAGVAKIVLPVNAFAMSAGLVQCQAAQAMDRSVEGHLAVS